MRHGGLVKVCDSVLMPEVRRENERERERERGREGVVCALHCIKRSFIMANSSIYSLLIVIHCFSFVSQSKYKSLLISERTTVDQMIQLVLNCYNSTESVNLFSIYEVSDSLFSMSRLPTSVQCHIWVSSIFNFYVIFL